MHLETKLESEVHILLLNRNVRSLQFGEIDIDSSLVHSKQDLPDSSNQIMKLSNGCMCCTVQEDLVSMLGELVSTLDSF